MLQNDGVLKHGPLAKVWLAAHWDRKLSKPQLLHTSIPNSVEAIVHPDDDTIVLRVSGQLLLGVSRIYSRKVKYLQDDCNDALLRIKMAFRNAAAMVDMAPEQLHVSRAAFTLPDTCSPMDLLMPDPGICWGQGSSARRNANGARLADITLPSEQFHAFEDESAVVDNSVTLDFQGDAATDLDLGLTADAQERPPPLRKRQRKEPFSSSRVSRHSLPGYADPLPGLDADDSYASVGVARDAQGHATTAAEHVQGLLGDVDMSADISADAMPHLDEMDVSTDVVNHDAAAPPVPHIASTPMSSRVRSSTPLREMTFDEAIAMPGQLTPRTAAKVRTAALKRSTESATAAAKGMRKRPAQDNVTEMHRIGMARHLMPRDTRSLALVLLQQSGQMSHFSIAKSLQATWGAAVTELDATVPLLDGARQLAYRKRALAAFLGGDGRRREMQQWLWQIRDECAPVTRSADDEEYPAEVGRRAEDAGDHPAPWLGDTTVSDLTRDEDMPMLDDDMAPKGVGGFDISMGGSDIPDISFLDHERGEQNEPDGPGGQDGHDDAQLRRSRRHHAEDDAQEETGRLPPLPRLATPLEEEDEDTVHVDVPDTNPLEAFETRQREYASSTGWDASTRRAAHVLRIKMVDDSADLFSLSSHATRRAAAGFFFELLVLGSRGCVHLSQDEAYGDVAVTGTSKLCEV
ncbi:sister chromatid cohesion protein 1 [Malassezia sp. CBS 17886]|nr:sister chromatid cohesion protein 1 [Malassezia sp. CBS 17886]